LLLVKNISKIMSSDLQDTATGPSLPACIDPNVKQFGGNRAQFIGTFAAVFSQAWADYLAMNPSFQGWLNTRKFCQSGCMSKVFDESAKTMWGTGQLVSPAWKVQFLEALTGSFKACYPTPPLALTKQVMTQVVDKVHAKLKQSSFSGRLLTEMASQEMLAATRKLAALAPCTAAGRSPQQRAAFLEKFEMSYPSAMLRAETLNPAAQVFFKQKTKKCQHSCEQKVLKYTAENLWDTGIAASDPTGVHAKDAFTGAIKACFPNMTHATAGLLVQSFMQEMGTAQSRLYEVPASTEQASAASLLERVGDQKSMLLIAGIAGFAALMASMIACRVWRGFSSETRAVKLRQDDVDDDAALE